ncbi:MAG: elongation factor P [Chlamydiota bacterium]|nr:elongation factor P [Chlamydiota bacterium]
MVASNQVNPGIIIKSGEKLFRVESSVKVTVAKGTPFVKMKLRDLSNDKLVEKNFKPTQQVEEVALNLKPLEFLYLEGSNYLFLDTTNLEQVEIPAIIVGDSVNFLKEGVVLNAQYYNEEVYGVELPQFLELMVSKLEGEDDDEVIANSTRIAILETGAKVEVPPFIEIGDIIKVDTKSSDYIQRV